MIKIVATEIITYRKDAEDKAWRQKEAARCEELGLGSPKVYRVMGRESGRVFIEVGEVESWDDYYAWGAKYGGDEVLQALEDEKAEKGIIVEGSREVYILVDY